MRGAMAPFERLYTTEQKDALANAYLDRGIRPSHRVAELAEAGELQEGLEPFPVTGGGNTVRQYAAAERKRRVGRITSDLAKMPPRDAAENIRQRLANLMSTELARAEERQRKGREAIDPEWLRQMGRAAREFAAIPGKQEPRPLRPGAGRSNGERQGGETTGGLAGAILRDHQRAGREPAPDAQTTHTHTGESSTPEQAPPEQGMDTDTRLNGAHDGSEPERSSGAEALS